MAEVLKPTRKDLTEEFERGFVGMSESPVSLDALLQAWEDLIAAIVGGMPDAHRQFLLSFKSGSPAWDLLALPGAQNLPAVRWKLGNLARMDQSKRGELLARLRQALKTTQ